MMFKYNNVDIMAGVRRVLPGHRVQFDFTGCFTDTWTIKHISGGKNYSVEVDYKYLFNDVIMCKDAVKKLLLRFLMEYE